MRHASTAASRKRRNAQAQGADAPAGLLALIESNAGAGGWTLDLATDQFECTDGLHHLLALPAGVLQTLPDLLSLLEPDDRVAMLVAAAGATPASASEAAAVCCTLCDTLLQGQELPLSARHLDTLLPFLLEIAPAAAATTSAAACRTLGCIIFANSDRLQAWAPRLCATLCAVAGAPAGPASSEADTARYAALVACGNLIQKGGARLSPLHGDAVLPALEVVLTHAPAGSGLPPPAPATARLLASALRVLQLILHAGTHAVKEAAAKRGEEGLRALYVLSVQGSSAPPLKTRQPTAIPAPYRPPPSRTRAPFPSGRSVSGSSWCTDESDSEGEGGASGGEGDEWSRRTPATTSRQLGIRVVVGALHCVEAWARQLPRSMHSKWSLFIPDMQGCHPKPFQPTLLTLLLFDSSTRVREAAALALGAALCDAPLEKWIGEAPLPPRAAAAF